MKVFKMTILTKILKDNYQFYLLIITFKIKHDLHRKCRIVVGGHIVNVDHLDTSSSTINSISAHINLIAKVYQKYVVLMTDMINVCLYTNSTEKVYMRLDKEFGDLKETKVIIHKTLHRLCISSKYFKDHLWEV